MVEQFPYEDIVNLPSHISKKYPQPTMLERAARFAPFAAITGYEERVLEEARVTYADLLLHSVYLPYGNVYSRCYEYSALA
jgi:hypothetical protein